ncbi:MAG: UDP-N-acetylglucosamine 2-epimerase (non-hydrolyzing) [Candidatus Brocadiaceae bacterium]|nr:UDP-N-acetylglucosamine 2-epimerase (non-hydrolyzing) [Candidatus Brocadiaceae bacterium]
MKIMSVVGARPNFMKIAPFVHAIERYNEKCGSQDKKKIEHYLVHTGQHYDKRMSESFFDVLNIPHPDIDLKVGSGTHAEQVGNTMIQFEKVVRRWKPDWVVVVGDVNATCACSITAKKEHVKLAHIESGLRSFDLKMPEEINRMVTDRLSDLLFTTDEMANKNLRKEGVPGDKIKFVGNIMIDTLMAQKVAANALELNQIIARNKLESTDTKGAFVISNNEYAIVTLHRPSNVDNAEVMVSLVNFFINEISHDISIVWTVHPRTRERLEEFGMWKALESAENIVLLHPIGYIEMLKLNMCANVMFTDSGGLQEECCVLGTPCLTLRSNTERPVTLVENGGASLLVGNEIDCIRQGYHSIKKQPTTSHCPELWDGKTAERIVDVLVRQR